MMNAVCLAMFGIGPTEMLVGCVVVLLLFGNRLPEAMRGIGRGIKEFREGVSGIEQATQPELRKGIEEVAP